LGILSQIATKNESIDQYFQRTNLGFGGGITKAGTLVSQQTALRLSTLLACIRVKTESFGCLPCSVYRRRPNRDGQDEAYDHPLYEILHTQPNEKMSALTFRESLNLNFDADGNSYAVIDFDKRGRVTKLTPIPYYNMEPYYDPIADEVIYYCYDRGKSEVLPARKVYHVPGFSWDGLKGISIIRAAAETFGRGLALDDFTNRFFGQGMNFGMVLEFPNEVKDREQTRKEFEEKYGGLHNSHKPVILTNGGKISRIPISFVDAQLIEMMNLTDMQICGLERVPPHMIAHLERSTNNNIEHQGIEFVVYSMLPVVAKHEQEANRKLFSTFERDYFVKYDLDEFMRGDSAAQATALAQMRQNGIINADEWREMKDWNPIGGVEGQARLVNGNMISTENAAKQLPKQAGNTPQPGGKEV
jgi:HK97 family phage portal protein